MDENQIKKDIKLKWKIYETVGNFSIDSSLLSLNNLQQNKSNSFEEEFEPYIIDDYEEFIPYYE